MSFTAMMALGLALEAAVGWPDRLHARIGHPVVWIGRLTGALERRQNHGGAARRRLAGALCVAVVLGATVALAALAQALLPEGAAGIALGAVLAWPWLAARSLHAHVAAVAAPPGRGDLAQARRRVAMIVGRDPARLDSAGVARAALESLAENASDGVVAPLFWGAALGLPGLAGYKAVNTLDSMIGHRTMRYIPSPAGAEFDDLTAGSGTIQLCA